VAVWLRRQGVEKVRSLAGGIDRWSEEIDARVARY
jgi:rhodanese-related sulfurtransferase